MIESRAATIALICASVCYAYMYNILDAVHHGSYLRVVLISLCVRLLFESGSYFFVCASIV